MEYLSVSRTYHVDPLTHKKRSIPWKRTLFITLRPGKELWEAIKKAIPNAIDTYMFLPPLIKYLEELQ
jgi:hypothetical protein